MEYNILLCLCTKLYYYTFTDFVMKEYFVFVLLKMCLWYLCMVYTFQRSIRLVGLTINVKEEEREIELGTKNVDFLDHPTVLMYLMKLLKV